MDAIDSWPRLTGIFCSEDPWPICSILLDCKISDEMIRTVVFEPHSSTSARCYSAVPRCTFTLVKRIPSVSEYISQLEPGPTNDDDDDDGWITIEEVGYDVIELPSENDTFRALSPLSDLSSDDSDTDEYAQAAPLEHSQTKDLSTPLSENRHPWIDLPTSLPPPLNNKAAPSVILENKVVRPVSTKTVVSGASTRTLSRCRTWRPPSWIIPPSIDHMSLEARIDAQNQILGEIRQARVNGGISNKAEAFCIVGSCPGPFSSVNVMLRHVAQHFNVTTQCEYCQATFNSRQGQSSLLRHKRRACKRIPAAIRSQLISMSLSR